MFKSIGLKINLKIKLHTKTSLLIVKNNFLLLKFQIGCSLPFKIARGYYSRLRELTFIGMSVGAKSGEGCEAAGFVGTRSVLGVTLVFI